MKIVRPFLIYVASNGMNEGKWHRPYHQIVLQEQEQGPTTDLLGHTGEPLFFYQKQEGFVPQWQLSKTHNIAISNNFFFIYFMDSPHLHKHAHTYTYTNTYYF